jgi:mannose-1-phosphate guanylyltransferase
VLGVFPSDHVIADEPRFPQGAAKGHRPGRGGDNMVVLGIEPTRAETGYGYIETGDYTRDDSALHVRRFTEKPNQNRAEEFVAAGNYFWNSGMFLWSARTLANAVREHLPETAPLLESIAAAYGTPRVRRGLSRSIPSAKTSPSTTRSSSRARPRASTCRTSTACPRSSVGTTSAPGPRSTSTSLKPACAATATAT